MIKSSMAETLKTCNVAILVSYHKTYKKISTETKIYTQKKYKNIKITKKCIVSVPNTVPNNLVMFNPMYKK